MSITKELEELKYDLLQDIQKSLEKGINIPSFLDNEKELKELYMQFFYDFMDDFPLESFCVWLETNLGCQIKKKGRMI